MNINTSVRNTSMLSAATASPLSPLSPLSPTTPPTGYKQDRRMSAEWDAALVPPSRFQKPKGSIYAVPGSRDGHVDQNYPAKFHELCHEKGYDKLK